MFIRENIEWEIKSFCFCRDLAARNCLVDRNGRVKVSDFGLSRCLEDNTEYFTQTKEFPVRWWAVEVLSNGLLNFIYSLKSDFLSGPYTNKSDVWSYGITVWEIFSKAALPYTHIQVNHFVIDAVKRGKIILFFNVYLHDGFDIKVNG